MSGGVSGEKFDFRAAQSFFKNLDAVQKPESPTSGVKKPLAARASTPTSATAGKKGVSPQEAPFARTKANATAAATNQLGRVVIGQAGQIRMAPSPQSKVTGAPVAQMQAREAPSRPLPPPPPSKTEVPAQPTLVNAEQPKVQEEVPPPPPPRDDEPISEGLETAPPPPPPEEEAPTTAAVDRSEILTNSKGKEEVSVHDDENDQSLIPNDLPPPVAEHAGIGAPKPESSNGKEDVTRQPGLGLEEVPVQESSSGGEKMEAVREKPSPVAKSPERTQLETKIERLKGEREAIRKELSDLAKIPSMNYGEYVSIHNEILDRSTAKGNELRHANEKLEKLTSAESAAPQTLQKDGGITPPENRPPAPTVAAPKPPKAETAMMEEVPVQKETAGGGKMDAVPEKPSAVRKAELGKAIVNLDKEVTTLRERATAELNSKKIDLTQHDEILKVVAAKESEIKALEKELLALPKQEVEVKIGQGPVQKISTNQPEATVKAPPAEKMIPVEATKTEVAATGVEPKVISAMVEEPAVGLVVVDPNSALLYALTDSKSGAKGSKLIIGEDGQLKLSNKPWDRAEKPGEEAGQAVLQLAGILAGHLRAANEAGIAPTDYKFEIPGRNPVPLSKMIELLQSTDRSATNEWIKEVINSNRAVRIALTTLGAPNPTMLLAQSKDMQAFKDTWLGLQEIAKSLFGADISPAERSTQRALDAWEVLQRPNLTERDWIEAYDKTKGAASKLTEAQTQAWRIGDFTGLDPARAVAKTKSSMVEENIKDNARKMLSDMCVREGIQGNRDVYRDVQMLRSMEREGFSLGSASTQSLLQEAGELTRAKQDASKAKGDINSINMQFNVGNPNNNARPALAKMFGGILGKEMALKGDPNMVQQGLNILKGLNLDPKLYQKIEQDANKLLKQLAPDVKAIQKLKERKASPDSIQKAQAAFDQKLEKLLSQMPELAQMRKDCLGLGGPTGDIVLAINNKLNIIAVRPEWYAGRKAILEKLEQADPQKRAAIEQELVEYDETAWKPAFGELIEKLEKINPQLAAEIVTHLKNHFAANNKVNQLVAKETPANPNAIQDQRDAHKQVLDRQALLNNKDRMAYLKGVRDNPLVDLTGRLESALSDAGSGENCHTEPIVELTEVLKAMGNYQKTV